MGFQCLKEEYLSLKRHTGIFGFAGCFIVSFSISYLFSWLLKQGLMKSNYFFLTWYIVFDLHSFRSIWHQNFSYFRLFTIMILIYFANRFICNRYVSNRRLVPV